MPSEPSEETRNGEAVERTIVLQGIAVRVFELADVEGAGRLLGAAEGCGGTSGCICGATAACAI